MPRRARQSVGGIIYHVLNRANARRRLFFGERDYAAFLKVLGEARKRWPGVEVFAFCVMPNHWHLVVRPSRDGELSAFMRWLTQTHTQRWRHAKETVGYGALYQGRFKSFVVQEDRHFLALCRYVESNAVRAKTPLADRAEAWRWGSAWARRNGDRQQLLSPWPVDRPGNWTQVLNESQPAVDEEQIRKSVDRGRPLGDAGWVEQTVKRLGLGHTMRPPGRPKGRRVRDGKNGDGVRFGS